MTIQEAINLLTKYQQWRLGNDDYPMQVPSEITEALDIVLNHCVGTLKLPQQEISDEEIEKGAKEWYDKEGAYSPSRIALRTWVYAIRWYREELKSKQNLKNKNKKKDGIK